MKKLQLSIALLLVSGLIFTTSLFSQEKAEVTVIVKKEGKVVHDTTYTYDDASKAKHVIKLADAMSKEDPHGEMMMIHKEGEHEMHLKMHEGEEGHNMVYVFHEGEDCGHKVHGDSLVWISKEMGEDGDVKVIKKQIKVSGHPEGGEHVHIVAGKENEKIDIFMEDGTKKVIKIKEDGSGNITKIIETDDGQEKHVEVVVIKKGEGDAEWHIESAGDEDVHITKELEEKELKKKQEQEMKEKQVKKEKKQK